MSAIAGKFCWGSRRVEQASLEKMLAKMQRRGQDSQGVWLSDSIGLAQASFYTHSQDANHPYPLIDKDLSLVFDGALYNAAELRSQLQKLGQQFQFNTDAEVVIKAYRQWGAECVRYFDGAFAFGIWDESHQTLWLVRDRFGEKPVYFAPLEQGFSFASTPQALLSLGEIDTSLNPIALHFQFSLHGVVPAPHTIFNGIKKLQPGHSLTVQPDGQIFVKCYWSLEANEPAEQLSEAEWQEKTHYLLTQAVKKRWDTTDLSKGVLLSGGLDSSLIVGLLAQVGVEEIPTFSIGFEDVGAEKGSEFEYSDLVVERYATKHKKLIVQNSQVLPRLSEAVNAMSEPMFGQDAVAFYLLAEQVGKEARVILSGQGADEAFAGYFWYEKMVAAQGSDLERFAPFYLDRSHEEWLEMMSSTYHQEDTTRAFLADKLAEPNAKSYLDKVLRLDTTTLIVDDPMKRVNNMTSVWGLDSRMPFLDRDLIEATMQMPPEYKLAQGGKGILKDIARGLVPDPVIDRPKGYFPMPALKYVRGEFLEFMREILLSPQAKARDLYNPKYIAKLLENPESPENFTAIQGSKLWHSTLLEYWLQQNL